MHRGEHAVSFPNLRSNKSVGLYDDTCDHGLQHRKSIIITHGGRKSPITSLKRCSTGVEEKSKSKKTTKKLLYTVCLAVIEETGNYQVLFELSDKSRFREFHSHARQFFLMKKMIWQKMPGVCMQRNRRESTRRKEHTCRLIGFRNQNEGTSCTSA